MKTGLHKSLILGCAIGLILSLNGCQSVSHNLDTAETLAQAGRLERSDVQAGSFVLATWQKYRQPGAPIHVYIEGDGRAWISRSTPSNNPTPTDPVALRLAVADSSPNVIYMARPCQFTDHALPGNHCTRDFWTGARFAPEVIRSYKEALDQLARKYDPVRFHLIGYSGGANIAGILASQRTDVASLRTVAGNIDNDFFTEYHQVSAMPRSLNMADQPGQLASMPQYHFIAEHDDFVPMDIYTSYARKLGSSHCIQSAVVPGTTHQDRWDTLWPALLTRTPSCQ